jgi:5-methylcytosine-specific restriction endonuclease McrA
VRRRIQAPGVSLTRVEFLAWHDAVDKSCRYCGLPDSEVPKIEARTQVGHPLRFLGIDRLANDSRYEPGNIALCCYPCNKVKGNVFDDAEMRDFVGPAIGHVWLQRIRRAVRR